MKTIEGEKCGFCRTTVKIADTGKCFKCSEVQREQVAKWMGDPWPEIMANHKQNLQLSCRRWG